MKVFINLPVRDLKKSMDFFTGLGFSFNPQFTDDTAACMIFSEEGYAMLLTHDKWKEFTGREICDTQKSAEVIICISAESREAVNEMADKAVQHGGSEPVPAKDYGFMYQRSFQDMDGHLWEVLYMDMAALPWEQGAEAVSANA